MPHILQENTFNDKIFISNDTSMKDIMQDIAKADSAKIINTLFDASFDTKSLADLYTIIANSPLLFEFLFEKRKSTLIKSNTTILICKNLLLVQK